MNNLSNLRWFLSLAAKFLRVAPFNTVVVICLTLIGQIAYIFSFFLPLKIVILLSSDGVPKYFPAFFSNLDKDFLVVLLSVSAISFFVINMITEKLTDRVALSATLKLMNRSHKLVIYEKQSDIAGNAYQSFSRSLAALVFGVLTIALLSLVYRDMAIVMVVYLFFSSAILFFLPHRNASLKDYIVNNLNVILDNVSAFGFFVVFGYLVLDFVFLEPPGIIFAVVSILAGRQVFTRVTSSVKSLFRLYNQKQKLDVLFFHGRALSLPEEVKQTVLWDCLSFKRRHLWVSKIFEEFKIIKSSEADYISRHSISWQQPPISQMGALIIKLHGFTYLIKVYDRNKSVGFNHEATLLSEAPDDLPAPFFIGTTQVQGFPCSLYELKNGGIERSIETKRYDTDLLHNIYSVIPPTRLVNRYLRSKPTLPTRMDTAWLIRVEVAVISEKQGKSLENLAKHWELIRLLISDVPLSIFNPFTKSMAVWTSYDGVREAMFWEKWSLEPIGAGWPVEFESFLKLEKTLISLFESRPDLVGFTLKHIKLVALIFEFENLILKQRFDMAVRLVPRIWKISESLLKININLNEDSINEN
ncbi:hypothetical protein [Vreelandella janggokensis]|uniref:Uncharacterized protein n=1 Tax=Vreelandella janggokensis TaxID=370767 RepID=A0ABT4IPZ6_9GAMM|nr:hypothetical protein [Halomonas janggokensis]MCZ0925753.1 hypothetical protein [Halomonas janggokensis]